MKESTTRVLYDVQSKVYDYTFGALVQRRISTAISHINIRPGDRVLDMGIGTGAALQYYPQHVGRIFGVDLSSGMLRLCKDRMTDLQTPNATIMQGDALVLPFADNAFDHVFVSHVISVVSDPCRLLREAQRVAKPDARIVILNHFASPNRFVAFVEKILCPLCTKLGWHTDVDLQDLLRRTGAEVDYRFKLASIDLWDTVVMSNNKSALFAEPAMA